jgi:hypothetical protein
MMFNRTSALWLVLGLVGGYTVAGPPVKAQNAAVSPVPPFLGTGDDVTLQFERGTYHENVHSIRCTVAAIEGIWLRCGPAVERFDPQREQRWLNLERVIQITERDQ